MLTEGKDEVRGTMYEMGDCVLLRTSKATKALESKWLGTYKVVGGTHPRYTLRRDGWRRSGRVDIWCATDVLRQAG